jgi:hypothetical protein
MGRLLLEPERREGVRFSRARQHGLGIADILVDLLLQPLGDLLIAAEHRVGGRIPFRSRPRRELGQVAPRDADRAMESPQVRELDGHRRGRRLRRDQTFLRGLQRRP